MAKKIIGIIGGIGSGKSSAASCFAQLGCAVIDADRLAHKVLQQKNTLQEIKKIFGQAVFDTENKLSTQKLAEIVFADAEKLERLNDLIHPPVMKEVESLVAEYNRDEAVKAIVLDIPLLVEVGWEKKCDLLIFVSCDMKKRVERATQKGDFFKKQLEKRENFQISLDKKVKIADYTIDNNSDLTILRGQVTKIFSAIC